MPLLKRGVECDEVEELQDHLGVEVTGTYDAATEAAVKAWQGKAGLAASGIADPPVLLAMDLEDLIGLEVGDKGDFVKALQTKLGIKADGIYGKSTEKAVDKYQEEHDLEQNGDGTPEVLRHLGLIGGDAAPPQPVAPAAPAPKAAPKVSAQPAGRAVTRGGTRSVTARIGTRSCTRSS